MPFLQLIPDSLTLGGFFFFLTVAFVQRAVCYFRVTVGFKRKELIHSANVRVRRPSASAAWKKEEKERTTF